MKRKEKITHEKSEMKRKWKKKYQAENLEEIERKLRKNDKKKLYGEIKRKGRINAGWKLKKRWKDNYDKKVKNKRQTMKMKTPGKEKVLARRITKRKKERNKWKKEID